MESIKESLLFTKQNHLENNSFKKPMNTIKNF